MKAGAHLIIRHCLAHFAHILAVEAAASLVTVYHKPDAVRRDGKVLGVSHVVDVLLREEIVHRCSDRQSDASDRWEAA